MGLVVVLAVLAGTCFYIGLLNLSENVLLGIVMWGLSVALLASAIRVWMRGG